MLPFGTVSHCSQACVLRHVLLYIPCSTHSCCSAMHVRSTYLCHKWQHFSQDLLYCNPSWLSHRLHVSQCSCKAGQELVRLQCFMLYLLVWSTAYVPTPVSMHTCSLMSAEQWSLQTFLFSRSCVNFSREYICILIWCLWISAVTWVCVFVLHYRHGRYYCCHDNRIEG